MVGVDWFRLPARASLRLNGRSAEDVGRVNDGGSMRVNGADVRRALSCAMLLRGGDRPAGALRGALTGDARVLTLGVCKYVGMDVDGMYGVTDGFEVTSEKEEGLDMPMSHLLRLLGEAKMAGSTFSESKSSKPGEGRRLLPEDPDPNGDALVMLQRGLFPCESGLETRPGECVRELECVNCGNMLQHTVLAILHIGELLQSRTVESSKWSSWGRHWCQCSHDGRLQ